MLAQRLEELTAELASLRSDEAAQDASQPHGRDGGARGAARHGARGTGDASRAPRRGRAGAAAPAARRAGERAGRGPRAGRGRRPRRGASTDGADTVARLRRERDALDRRAAQADRTSWRRGRRSPRASSASWRSSGRSSSGRSPTARRRPKLLADYRARADGDRGRAARAAQRDRFGARCAWRCWRRSTCEPQAPDAGVRAILEAGGVIKRETIADGHRAARRRRAARPTAARAAGAREGDRSGACREPLRDRHGARSRRARGRAAAARGRRRPGDDVRARQLPGDAPAAPDQGARHRRRRVRRWCDATRSTGSSSTRCSAARSSSRTHRSRSASSGAASPAPWRRWTACCAADRLRRGRIVRDGAGVVRARARGRRICPLELERLRPLLDAREAALLEAAQRQAKAERRVEELGAHDRGAARAKGAARCGAARPLDAGSWRRSSSASQAIGEGRRAARRADRSR